MTNIIREKSFVFAIEVVDVYKILVQKHEYVLSKQLLKSGTSIGANIEEALRGQSRKDFHAKMTIALKEASETYFWLRLLAHAYKEMMPTWKRLQESANEIIAILVAITRSTKHPQNLNSAFRFPNSELSFPLSQIFNASVFMNR